MNIVYKITFTKRQESNILPYFYIGSKSNCTFKDGKIYDNRNREYYGTSLWPNYKDIVKSDICKIEVIKAFDNYTDTLNYESMIQRQLDVVADPKYFNKSIAAVNSFTDPSYATYKHVETGKMVRLPRDHRMVLSGEYVGITKGNILSEEHKKKIKRVGKENGFYGKSHTSKTKALIAEKNKNRKKSKKEIDNWIEKVAKKKKSKEHRSKIGRKGMIMLKNRLSLETIRIKKEDSTKYDLNIWLNPVKLNKIIRDENKTH